MFSRIDPTSKRKLIVIRRGTLLAALLCCALVAACSKAPVSDQTKSSSRAEVKTVAQSPAGTQPSAALEDKGDFELIYGEVKDEKLLRLEKMFKDSKLFDTIIADLNKELSLPVDVPVRFLECAQLPDTSATGVENAWFNPEDNGIVICYELIAKSESLFKDDEPSPEELEESVLGATAWTFYHELGHALVSIYKLPITGKEEDSVDQLSTYILVSGGDAGERAALNGAMDFKKEEERDGDVDDTALADSHSLSKQRFFNIICWVYGQNEEKYAELAKGDLPENRAGGCKAEFDQISNSWETLLTPYAKN